MKIGTQAKSLHKIVLEKLISTANELDQRGLYAEADEIDSIVRSAAELDPHKEEKLLETFEPSSEKPSPYTREEWLGDKEEPTTKKGPSQDARRVALKYRLKKMFTPSIDKYLSDDKLDMLLNTFGTSGTSPTWSKEDIYKFIVGGLPEPKSEPIKALQDTKRNLMQSFKPMTWGTSLAQYMTPKFLKRVIDEFGTGANFSKGEKYMLYRELIDDMFHDRLVKHKCVECGNETGEDYLTKLSPSSRDVSVESYEESEDIISSPLCKSCLAKPTPEMVQEFLERCAPQAMERLVEMHEDITDPSEMEEKFSYPEKDEEEEEQIIYPEDRADDKSSSSRASKGKIHKGLDLVTWLIQHGMHDEADKVIEKLKIDPSNDELLSLFDLQ